MASVLSTGRWLVYAVTVGFGGTIKVGRVPAGQFRGVVPCLFAGVGHGEFAVVGAAGSRLGDAKAVLSPVREPRSGLVAAVSAVVVVRLVPPE